MAHLSESHPGMIDKPWHLLHNSALGFLSTVQLLSVQTMCYCRETIESKLLSAAEYKQFEKTNMGQELHLHNYIVNGKDNENGAGRKQKNIK